MYDKCHLCEMKFSDSPFKIVSKDIEKMNIRKAVFKNDIDYKHHIFNTLITTFTPIGTNTESNFDQIITMDKLFKALE
jgi:hypothetical protein